MRHRKIKALIAVSSEKISSQVGDILAARGISECYKAHTQHAAVDLMHENLFSLFIVDGQLLISDDKDKIRIAGVDFVRFIRMCDGVVSEANVVFLRSNRQAQNLLEARAEIIEARDSGATCIVGHPLTVEKFENLIEPILKQARIFIRDRTYTGPCRRYKNIPVEKERRKIGHVENTM